MQSINQDFVAGQIVEFAIPGKYFRFRSGSGPCNVTFFRGGSMIGEIADVMPGAWAKLPEFFDKVRIINGDVSSSVVFIIGNGESGMDSIIGEVTVRDSSVIRTIAGAAYVAKFQSVPAATQFAFAQVWNPPGSGSRLVVKNAIARLSVNGSQAFFCGHDTAIGGTANAGILNNKTLGGAWGVSECRQESRASSVPPGGIWPLFESVAAFNVDQPLPCAEDLIINPGQGLLIYTKTAISTLNGLVEWYEERL